MTSPVSPLKRKLATFCLRCPACRRARQRQRGFCFWFVRKVESSLCPMCRAYAKLTGRKSHEGQPAR